MTVILTGAFMISTNNSLVTFFKTDYSKYASANQKTLQCNRTGSSFTPFSPFDNHLQRRNRQTNPVSWNIMPITYVLRGIRLTAVTTEVVIEFETFLNGQALCRLHSLPRISMFIPQVISTYSVQGLQFFSDTMRSHGLLCHQDRRHEFFHSI